LSENGTNNDGGGPAGSAEAVGLSGRVLAVGTIVADRAVWKVLRRLGAETMERVKEGSAKKWWIAAEAYTRGPTDGCGWEGVAVVLDPSPGAGLRAEVWWGRCGAWDL
jgi:hypothetical protein